LAEVKKDFPFLQGIKPYDTMSFEMSGLKQPDGMKTTAFWAIPTFRAPSPTDINVGVGSTVS
jgi:hypothetical protein